MRKLIYETANGIVETLKDARAQGSYKTKVVSLAEEPNIFKGKRYNKRPKA